MDSEGNIHFVKTATNINGRCLNDAVDDLRQGCEEIRRVYLRVEEDFRS